MSTHDPMTTPARRDAATGDTTMRTQEPTMTERTENEHVDAIKRTLGHYLLQPIPATTPDVWEISTKQIDDIFAHLDALAARLAAAEADAAFTLEELIRVTREGERTQAERDAERAKVARLQYAVAFLNSEENVPYDPKDLGLHDDDLTDGSGDDA